MGTTLEPGERLKLAEERRSATEGVLWQLPSISIAAQAFLLSVGLAPDASGWARILVGLLGAFVVLATGFVVAFQGVQMTVLGRWIDQTLDKSLDLDILVRELKLGHELNMGQRLLLNLPTPFWFWGITLVGFLVADVFVFSRGL